MDEFSFGRQVRERRRALDLTQDELARRVACAVITVRRIEGSTLRPSQQVAERLAAALAIPLEDRAAFVRAARQMRAERRDEGPRPTPTPTPEEIGSLDLSGRAIRGYALSERVGVGGFGAVYRAVQPLVEREVAIKIILPRFADQPAFIRRFEAEAQVIARLEHPHIVPLYDFWREPGVAFLVMRLLRGGSLHTLLQHGPPPLEQIVAIVEQIGAALAVAHRAGVVHRDLKPANILLDEVGNAYLADFGIAKDLMRPAEVSFAGVFVGSPAYASPEQIRAEVVTPQTDIYALGVLLYELLSGQKPFPGSTPASYLEQHLSAPLPALTAARPDLPPALDRAIQRATAKLPAARFADVAELVAAVREALGAPGLVAPARSAQANGAAPPTLVLDLLEADNPYQGLRSFDEAAAGRFFGRETLVQQLLARMAEAGELARFLAVVGPSGSGKSSAVRAGLVPALRSGALPGSDQWYIVQLVPGAQPLESFAAALCTVAPAGVEADDLLVLLRGDQRGLLRAARLILPVEPAAELLLVVDQFEELFTLSGDEAARSHLLESLVTAILDPRSRLRLVLTLRADFIDRPLQYVDLGELLQQRSELVLPLSLDELERAIVEPARRLGLTLEEGLVAALVADVSAQPGSLPLLQHSLSELFARRDGRMLTRKAYAALGGVAGALAHSAEERFLSLDEPNRRLARQLFLRLVTPGEAADDIRRRAPLGELQSLLGGAGSTKGALLEHFGAARLLTFDRHPATREPTVEVAHEALLRAWPRLRSWLDGARNELRVQRRLSEAAATWAQLGREPAYLATGGWLSQYEALGASETVAITPDERAFLDASVAQRAEHLAAEQARQARELAQAQALTEEQQRRAGEQQRAATVQRRRARYLAFTLALTLAAALAAGFFARRDQANLRVSARQILAAQANNLLQSNVSAELPALLAIQSLQTGYSTEADTALNKAFERSWSERVLVGHTGPIYAVAFSPDGRTVLSGSADATARLWDLASGQELRQFSEPDNGIIYDIAIAPDARSILTSGQDGVARLWDTQSGQLLRRFAGHTDELYGVVFAPDGKTILTGSFDGTARLWNVDTGQELRRFEGHTDKVYQVKFSPDGRTMLTASHDYTARLWEVASGKQIHSLVGHNGPVVGVAFSPDGRYLVSSSHDTTARLWDAASGLLLREFVGHGMPVLAVAFSPDGRQLLTSAQTGDPEPRLWDVETGQMLRYFRGHRQGTIGIAFSPDGMWALSGGLDNVARLWRIPAEPPVFIAHTDEASLIRLVWGGRWALTGGPDGTARLWDLTTGQALHQYGHPEWLTNLVGSPDRTLIVTTGVDNTIRLWDTTTEQELRRFVGHTDSIFGLSWSPDGAYLAGGGEDAVARIWDVATGQILQELRGHAGVINGVVFAPDGATLATTSQDMTARLWDVRTGQELRRFSGATAALTRVAFSPDGRSLFTGSFDKLVHMWDVASGHELRRFAGHTDGIRYLSIAANGQVLLSLSYDQTVRLWDVATGQELRQFSGDMVAAVLLPDGKQIVTGHPDGTVRLRPADHQELMRLVCAQLPRDLSDEERRQYNIADNGPTCP